MEVNGDIKVFGAMVLEPKADNPADAAVGTVWYSASKGLQLCYNIDVNNDRDWKRVDFDEAGNYHPSGEWIFDLGINSLEGFQAGTPHDNVILLASGRQVRWTVNDIPGVMTPVEELTEQREWTLPDKSGTVALLSDLPPTAATIEATSGTVAVAALDVNVAPTANSTAVTYARRDQLNFNVARQIQSGGWLSAHQSVVNVGSSAGTVDKIVADFSQVNIDGTAQINTILLYEVSISRIAAGAQVNGAVGFYFPNLRNVPNIGLLGTLAAFISDDPKAISRTQGPFFNRTQQEFAPPYHPGLVPGRYYTAPYRLIGDSATTANYAACVPVHVPHTATLSEIGFTVATGVASSQAVMAIYTAEKGRVQNLVWQSPSAVNTATAGHKTQAPNVELSPGTYWLLLLTSVNLTIKYHQPQSSDQRMSMLGQPAPDTQDNNLNRVAYLPLGGFAVGAFPAQIASVPSFLNQDGEPHVWFRVSA